jgi:hypothetical protein
MAKLDVKKAAKEIAEKSLDDIQKETAWTWAARSCAAYVAARKIPKDKAKWEHDALEYQHEATEHAALSEDDNLIHEIREAIRAYQKKD